ncbi:hypothetical protein J7T55_005110 [Diaporthe amygdali]|uniref:uncharacterized protein n=1 Tax=Phomopsis amygdali TaxID=1214568 RepID=UPI0022FEAF0D|nr:uncharacterized protein J7T55_005110 [Diaporthe amygdali]KAJ0116164.1 hypothetical protein J7T55_005110 [Diaporthe amygdali]
MTSTPTPTTTTDTSYDPATATPTYGTGAGPLTTVFQTPDFCASSLWENPMTPPLYSSICMPPNFNNYWNWQIGYYSPGICPSGYSAACEFPTSLALFSSFTDGTSSKSWPYYGGQVKPDETARLCCPTGYNCYSTGMMGVGWSYSLCISTVPSTTLRDPEQTTGTVMTTTENLAYAIQVRWREQDLSILQTNPTVPGQTNVPTQTATTATTQNETDSTNAPDTVSSGVSSGSLAVAVGVSVGVFALLLLSAILIWRLVRKRKQAAKLQRSEKDERNSKLGSSADTISTTLSSAPYSPNPVSPLTDIGARSITGTVRGNTAEIDSSPVAEMETGASTAAELAGDATKPVELATEEKPVEIETRDFVAELPGDMPANWREDVDGKSTRMNTRKQPGENWNWI